MPKYLQISIPAPCHENWDSMTHAERGRYCNSCQKTVIDFSSMTDEQLLDFFKENKKDVCGRFYDHQLKNPIPVPVRKIPWLTYFFKITIPAFLFMAKAAAQEVIKPRIEMVQPGADNKDNAEELPITVTGSVTNFSGIPVPFASVIIPGTNIGVAADELGRFKIRLMPAHRVLEISSVGYYTLQYAVKGPGDISIVLRQIATMGEVDVSCNLGKNPPVVITVGMTVIAKRSKPKPLKPVPDDSIRIYPNPVHPNELLTIQFSKSVKADQAIEIYSLTGALIQREIIPVHKSSKQIKIRVKETAQGLYIIKIIDLKRGVSESRQIRIK